MMTAVIPLPFPTHVMAEWVLAVRIAKKNQTAGRDGGQAPVPLEVQRQGIGIGGAGLRAKAFGVALASSQLARCQPSMALAAT